jgi:hypothetical protein
VAPPEPVVEEGWSDAPKGKRSKVGGGGFLCFGVCIGCMRMVCVLLGVLRFRAWANCGVGFIACIKPVVLVECSCAVYMLFVFCVFVQQYCAYNGADHTAVRRA